MALLLIQKIIIIKKYSNFFKGFFRKTYFNIIKDNKT